MTTDNSNKSPFKLKNPTEYHILATQFNNNNSNYGISPSHLHLHQQQSLSVLDDQHLDFSDIYYGQQQFLSPASNSPPLQDFEEDTDSLANSSAVIDNMMIAGGHQPYFFPSHHQQEESPSDYSSSVDFFSHPQPSSFLMDFHHHQRQDSISSHGDYNPRQPFSAPARMGYNNSLLSSSSSHIGMAAFHQPPEHHTPRSLEEYESIQINHQLLSEKKRRRRESHNAVERRRRENINERIQELGTMLPETMLEELASSVNVNGGNNNKPNKGAILRKSVDHIRILQQEVTNYKQRIYELERQLAALTSSAAS